MTLFTNGHFITMEQPGEFFRNMLVEDDKIVALGNDELLEQVDASITKHDLEGKTVLPGFYDSHLHLISTFLNEIAISFNDAKSISDVLEIIENNPYNQQYPVILGKRLSEFNLKERRLPTRKELDRVSKNFPVVISSIEFHTVLMNSYAMNLFKIPFTSEGYEKDGNNNFTGRLRNRSAFIALRKAYDILDEAMHLKGADKTFKKALSRGVTTMVSVEGGPLFHTKHPKILLGHKSDFPVDVELLYSTTDLKKIMKYGLPRVGGDLFLDGSFRSQNAALYKPYKDSKNNLGQLLFTKKELEEFIEHAHDLDLQVAIHAVGPRAIDFLLDAYETILSRKPKKDHRHRIEHFELPLPHQIKRVKELGLMLAMHPSYEYFFREEGMMYDTRLGKERSLETNPLRQIIDSGIHVAGCSDSDVMPIDPLLGIHAAVNHPNPASRITPYEAIEMFTINGAYGIFQENIKGSLKPGKRADFMVLNENPLTVDPERLKDVQVVQTYKNGKQIYEGRCHD